MGNKASKRDHKYDDVIERPYAGTSGTIQSNTGMTNTMPGANIQNTMPGAYIQSKIPEASIQNTIPMTSTIQESGLTNTIIPGQMIQDTVPTTISSGMPIASTSTVSMTTSMPGYTSDMQRNDIAMQGGFIQPNTNEVNTVTYTTMSGQDMNTDSNIRRY